MIAVQFLEILIFRLNISANSIIYIDETLWWSWENSSDIIHYVLQDVKLIFTNSLTTSRQIAFISL